MLIPAWAPQLGANGTLCPYHTHTNVSSTRPTALRTGYRLCNWLSHQQLCPIDGTDHAHEHALIMCANLAKR